MMKFWFHKYSMTPLTTLSAVTGAQVREGALIKVQWPNKKIGFSDLFPWPELGDKKVIYHLQELQKSRLTPLMEQSVYLAKKDAELRSKKQNALSGATRIKNHFLVTDFTKLPESKLYEAKSAGFSTLKVKVGRDWKEEIQWIEKTILDYEFSIRMDFNSQSDFSTFERMISYLPRNLKPKIEFIEDPFPWDYDVWLDASKLAPLAIDNEAEFVDWKKLPDKIPFKVLVIKPARQDVDQAVKKATERHLKMVITSSMDHPIALVGAIRVASELKTKYRIQVLDSGCITHKLYKPDEFSSKLIFTGPYLSQIIGTGMGFDKELENLDWTAIEMKK